uniref:Putative transcription factor grauzone n=1 Tax=Lutzomyia longipalpis TaxID=7200 RepID=A0A1B0CLJ3_LUTLO
METEWIKEELTVSSIICRLCLIQDAEYREIFTEGSDIPEILFSLMGISVSEFDNWPKRICMGCLSKIKDFQALATEARKNEGRLITVFGEYELGKAEQDLLSLSPIFMESVKDEDIKENSPEKESQEHEEEEGKKFEDEEEDKESVEEEPPEPPDDDDCWSPPSCSDFESEVSDLSEAELEELKKRKPPTRSQKIPKDLSKANQEDPKTSTTEKEPKQKRRKAQKFVMTKQTKEKIRTFFKMECPICKTTHASFTAIKMHFKREHDCPGYIICCKGRLKSHKMLAVHMRKHLDPLRLECPDCRKVFNSHENLRIHRLNKHTPEEEMEFVCDKCSKRFATKYSLTSHMMMHMSREEKKHVCSTCGAAFARSYILKSHIERVHGDPTMMVCEICAKSYTTRYNFERHMLRHKGKLKKTIPCSICGKLFLTRSQMKTHLRRHDTSTATACHLCSHVSVNGQALKEHITKNHMPVVNKYKCTMCERDFKRKVHLREHIAIHTGEMLYKCDFCPRQFYNGGFLYQHRKAVHPKEWAEKQAQKGRAVKNPKGRPRKEHITKNHMPVINKYKCTMCERDFKRKVHLREHIAIHTGEMLYKCDFCPRQFYNGGFLYQHRKAVHPKEWAEKQAQKGRAFRS